MHAHHWLLSEDLATPATCRTCGESRQFHPVDYHFDPDKKTHLVQRTHLERVVLNGWPFRTQDGERMSTGIAR